MKKMNYTKIFSEILEKYLKELRGIGVKPWKHQEKTWELLVKYAGEKIILLRAPTASGKTEAAIIPFFYQILYNDWFLAPGLIYVLPNKTLLFSQLRRIQRFAKIVLPENKFKRIRIVADLGGLHPYKTFLFGDIVLTTLDAFTYGLLARRTFIIRRNENLGKTLFPIGNIATSFIIFDEVQLYQDIYYYTPKVLRELITLLNVSGIPTLIMTATLPQKLKNEIISDEVEVIEVVCNQAVRKGEIEIENKIGENMNSFIQRELADLLNQHNRILIVRNTVKEAVKTYLLLKKLVKNRDFEIDLLHARLVEKARRERERKLEDIKDEDSRFILVATQVAESGLDIDFNIILTEIAPIDGLIQRIGRVARRKEIGYAYLFSPRTSHPYSPELLKKTLEVIRCEEKSLKLAVKRIDVTEKLLNMVYDKVPIVPSNLRKYLNATLRALNTLTPFTDLRVLMAKSVVRPQLYFSALLLPNISLEALNYMTELKIVFRQLQENCLNIPYKGNDPCLYPFLLKIDNSVFKADILRANMIDDQYILLRIRCVDKVLPENLYLIDPRYYKKLNNYDLGLYKWDEK